MAPFITFFYYAIIIHNTINYAAINQQRIKNMTNELIKKILVIHARQPKKKHTAPTDLYRPVWKLYENLTDEN